MAVCCDTIIKASIVELALSFAAPQAIASIGDFVSVPPVVTSSVVADLLTDFHVPLINALVLESIVVSVVVPIGAHIVVSMHDANKCGRK